MPITAKEAQSVWAEADCCYTQQQVEMAIDRIGKNLTEEYIHSNPLLLCVMNGGLITMGRLLLRLNFPLQYDYIHASRYLGQTSGGEIQWLAEARVPLSGRHILIVDDIIDEGITLNTLVEYFRAADAVSVKTVVLVNKKHDRKHGPPADFVGLDVEDRYVFGYGMDYKGYLRNAPGIYAVKGL